MLLPATLYSLHFLLLCIGEISKLLDVRVPLLLQTEIVQFCVQPSKQGFLLCIVHFIYLRSLVIQAGVAEVSLFDLFSLQEVVGLTFGK